MDTDLILASAERFYPNISAVRDKVQPLMMILDHQVHRDARAFIRNKDSDGFANKLLKCSSNEGCKLIQKYI